MIVHPKTQLELEQILHNNIIVVIKYSTRWCGPCKALQPLFEQLSNQYNDNIIFVGISCENEWMEYAVERNIKSVPYTEIYVSGSLFGFVKGNDIQGIANGLVKALQSI